MIQSLKTMEQNEDEKEQIFPDLCDKHGDTQDMFCMDCQEKICLTCGRRDHTFHSWSRTEKIVKCLRSELKEQLDVIRHKRVPLLQAEIQKIKSLKEQNEQLITAREGEILTHTADLVENIHRISDQLVNICRTFKEENDRKLDIKEKEIETYLTWFESGIHTLEGTEYRNISQLLRLKREVFHVPDIEDTVTLQKNEFQGKSHNENRLKSMIGEISLTYDNITFTKLFQSKSGENSVKWISPTSATQAWLREFRSSDSSLLDIGNRNSLATFVFKPSAPIPEDFITLRNGMHIYTCHVNQSVMTMSPMNANDELSSNIYTRLANISPLFPVGICSTAAGSLLLTAIDKKAFSEDLYTKYHPQKSVVIVLSNTGKTKKIYQYEEDGKTPLFLFPYRITENHNHDICVINRTSVSKGHICALSSSGKLKFRFNGPNSEAKFSPCGISCDALCNILISGEKCVYLVDKHGEFLTYLLTENYQLLSLNLFQNTLWIGGNQGHVSVYRYEVRDSSR